MNRKNKVLTIVMLGVLISSIYFSAPTKGAVAPDLLELTKGSYVKGKLLFSNATLTDYLVSNNEVSVVNVVNFTDIALNMTQIRVSFDIVDDELLGMDGIDHMEFTNLVLQNNRTLAMPIIEYAISNSTYSIKASLLDETTVAGVTNFDNTKVTIDGTTYIAGDVNSSHIKYDEISEIMFGFIFFNVGIGLEYNYTIFGVSPQANTGDVINFGPPRVGSVLDKPLVNTSLTESYETIHVKYDDTFTFAMDDLDEVDAYYETTTGLLIRSIEKDTASDSQLEFRPTEVLIKTNGNGLPTEWLPFPIIPIFSGFVAIGLIIVFIRKKK